MEEDDFMTDMFDKPWECAYPNTGLSMYLRHNEYDAFMKVFEAEFRVKYGSVDVESLSVKCEGQCPKGCEDKFKLKLGKSLTKKSFEKLYKHGMKHPKHCFVVNYQGVVKNGPVL